MLNTERAKRTCAKYSAYDETGHVHCHECPLVIDRYMMICRAFCHWDRHKQEWVQDVEGEAV